MKTDPLTRLTHALRQPETAVAAAEALRGAPARAAVEGLVELVHEPPTARAAVAAIAALESCAEPIVLDALLAALESPHVSVRSAAVGALQQRPTPRAAGPLGDVLQTDESWMVRRAALRALAGSPGTDRWRILDGLTDPHWRVRHALLQVLLEWGQTKDARREIDERIVRAGSDVRSRGVRAYLQYRWSARKPEPDLLLEAEDPRRRYGFWDWDAAVLARNLERLGDEGRRQALDALPYLLGHADPRVRTQAADALRHWGEPRHLAEALAHLDEPRTGAAHSVDQLLSSLDQDRIEEVARLLLHRPDCPPASLAWALDQADAVFPATEEEVALSALFRNVTARPAGVRAALTRLAARWSHPEAEGWLRDLLADADPAVRLEALRGLSQRPGAMPDEIFLVSLLDSELPSLRAEAGKVLVARDGDRGLVERLADDPDARVRLALAEALVAHAVASDNAMLLRLQADSHPHVRAAALTAERAAPLVEDPARETSWHVLAKAARLARVPLWRLEPDPPWRPAEEARTAPAPLHPSRPAPPHARALGPERLVVAPVGVSGHYGLPVEGFVRAVEAGVNLLFWEPNYQTLTEFLTRLPGPERNALHVLTGTFEADGKGVRRDAERALRTLQIDRIALFLLFWVQSWDRITPDVRESLERLKEERKVGTFSLSTHSRPLAGEAMEAGWDPVMVRHSAAHRGAEAMVFPKAVELGRSLITFNNTCYGRLLKAPGDEPPSAADCYRYTLAQPGVTACLSAPATLEQLEENLAALRDPELPADRRQRLLAHGERVYEEDVVFRRCVRSL